jgi:hypothetical protein
MSILSLIALKPVFFLALKSAPRTTIRLAQRTYNLLSAAAAERSRSVSTVYLTAMGMDHHHFSAADGRDREREQNY